MSTYDQIQKGEALFHQMEFSLVDAKLTHGVLGCRVPGETLDEANQNLAGLKAFIESKGVKFGDEEPAFIHHEPVNKDEWPVLNLTLRGYEVIVGKVHHEYDPHILTVRSTEQPPKTRKPSTPTVIKREELTSQEKIAKLRKQRAATTNKNGEREI